MKARKFILKIHLWLGLTIGLLWALEGATGAALVWWRDIDHLSAPTPAPGPAASLDDIARSVRQATPDAEIERFALTDWRRQAIDVYYLSRTGEERAVRIDAASARPIADYPLDPSSPFAGAPMRWVYELHSQLTAGTNGEVLIGLSGLLLLSSALLGIWLAWPPAGRWRGIFQFRRWKPLSAKLYGWHRAVGVSAGCGLIALAVTGAGMIFSTELRAVLKPVLPFEHVYSPMNHGSGDLSLGKQTSLRLNISPENARRIAEAQFAGSRWVRLFPPTPEKPLYSVRLYRVGENRSWIGATSVTIDPATGAVLQRYDALRVPFANRLIDALYPIHTGELFGLVGRLLTMAAGLSLPFFYITGIWAWVRKKKKKRLARAEKL